MAGSWWVILGMVALAGCDRERDPTWLLTDPGASDAGSSEASGSHGGVGSSAAVGDAATPTNGDPDGVAPLPGIAREEPLAPAGDAEPSDVLGQRVFSLLERHCASCHGDAAPSAIGSVRGMPGLIQNGWVVPGSSATSPLYAVLENGHVDGNQPTAGEVSLIARFIDELPGQLATCMAPQFVSTDAALATLAGDIATLPAESRPFARYLTLHYASNAGLCGPALARHRAALFEAVNSVSLGPSIVVPRAVDSGELIYRIDLRDYAFDRAIDVEDDGTSDFPDAWLAAVAAAGEYAIEQVGPDADPLKRETGTAVPWLPANAFVHAVAAGDLYSTLIGVRRDVEATRASLGVVGPTRAVDAPAGMTWASFDGPSGEVLVMRANQAANNDAYWMVEDVQYIDAESIFNSPFELEHSPRPVAFGLPNGLLGYAIEGSDSSRATEIATHGRCNYNCPSENIGLAACGACHARGPLPVIDQVRDVVLANAFQFADSELDEVLTSYPPQPELDAMLEAERATRRAALERTLVPVDEPDPVARVFHQFERQPLMARRAAAELGVTLEAFQRAARQLELPLALVTAGGTMDRSAFTAALPAARCTLHAEAANRPALCP